MKKITKRIIVAACVAVFAVSSIAAVACSQTGGDNSSDKEQSTYEPIRAGDENGLVYYVLQDGTMGVKKGDGDEEKVTVPASYQDKAVTAIMENGFKDEKTIVEIVLPDTLTQIGKNAFLHCEKLETVNIPSGVTIIGEDAFSGCEALKTVGIPDSVTTIGKWAFNSCMSLKSISIPAGVKVIEEYTFSNCQELEEICLSEGLERIGRGAFAWCGSLSDIRIPDSVVTIEMLAFSYCQGVAEVENDPESDFIISITLGGENSRLTTIEDDAFLNCSGLREIVIPDNVKKIGKTAFGGCTLLTKATIGASVEEIGAGAFASCGKLQSVIFKDYNNWKTGWSGQEIKQNDLLNETTAAKTLREKNHNRWVKTVKEDKL